MKEYGKKQYKPINKNHAKPKQAPRPPRTERSVEQWELPENLIYGRNAIREALKSGRQLDKLMVNKDMDGYAAEIVKSARQAGVPVVYLERTQINKITNTTSHQGMAAYVASQSYVEIADILAIARDKGEDPFILVADGLEDPHNLGAIIRTAECAGVHGVIIPKRRACGLTPVVSKVSAGAVEHMAIAKVNNTAAAIDELKAAGVWVAGADMGQGYAFDRDMTGPLALVVGSEGEGLSRLVKEKCDYLVAIPMFGKVDSLNVSAATSVITYEVVRQRLSKKAEQ